MVSAAVDNWYSRSYLALVAALLGRLLFVLLALDHPDASAAGAVPVLATLLVSLLAVAVAVAYAADGRLWLLFAGIAAGGLCNAWLLGMIVRGLRS